MAQTLLTAVNEILKRVRVIAGDSGEFTSLTDSARQPAIDIAVQVINEAMDALYTAADLAVPLEQAENTITLVQGTRSYALQSDLVQLTFPLIDKTNTQYIFEFKGGYNLMLVNDPEQDSDGLPLFAAISPVTGELYMDFAPTAADAGKIYTYQYDKDISMTLITDTVPFTDLVFRAMVPAWVQLWKREMRSEFDEALFNSNIGRAARLLPQKKARSSWSPRAA